MFEGLFVHEQQAYTQQQAYCRLATPTACFTSLTHIAPASCLLAPSPLQTCASVETAPKVWDSARQHARATPGLAGASSTTSPTVSTAMVASAVWHLLPR